MSIVVPMVCRGKRRVKKMVVRMGRVELPFPFGSQILSLVRLPIPPHSRATHYRKFKARLHGGAHRGIFYRTAATMHVD